MNKEKRNPVDIAFKNILEPTGTYPTYDLSISQICVNRAETDLKCCFLGPNFTKNSTFAYSDKNWLINSYIIVNNCGKYSHCVVFYFIIHRVMYLP